MFKSRFVFIFLCYSVVEVVESDGVASQPWLPAVPPVVRSAADAAEAFAYCAARAEHYASVGEGDRARYIDAARDFAYCASVAHCVKATAAPCVPTTCPHTPAPTCNCQHERSGPPATNAMLTTTQPAPPTNCDDNTGYEYFNVSGNCYKAHSEELLWPDADKACRDEGGLLAVIHSREEALVLGDLSNTTYSHIGVYRDSSDNWITVTGEDVVAAAGYDVWTEGEPWSEDKWRYGVVWSDGTIGTTSENHTFPFICERAS